MGTFLATIRFELRKKTRSSGEVCFPAIFYVLCIIFFPIALGSETFAQSGVASGAVWISAILASSISLENIFLRDYVDGSMELTVLSGADLPTFCLARATSYWLSSGLIILATSILVIAILGIKAHEGVILIVSLSIVTASISLIGAAVSALTAGLRAGSLLLVTLLLPLLVPPVIFGASATLNAARGLDSGAELLFLSGFFVLTLTLAPWATAVAVRVRIQ